MTSPSGLPCVRTTCRGEMEVHTCIPLPTSREELQPDGSKFQKNLATDKRLNKARMRAGTFQRLFHL